MSSVLARLGGFAAALLVAFGGAYAAGAAIGPLDDAADDPPEISDTSGSPDHGEGHGG